MFYIILKRPIKAPHIHQNRNTFKKVLYFFRETVIMVRYTIEIRKGILNRRFGKLFLQSILLLFITKYLFDYPAYIFFADIKGRFIIIYHCLFSF